MNGLLKESRDWLESNGFEFLDFGIWVKKGLEPSVSIGVQVSRMHSGNLAVRLMDHDCGFDALPSIEMATFQAFVAFMKNVEALNTWISKKSSVSINVEVSKV